MLSVASIDSFTAGRGGVGDDVSPGCGFGGGVMQVLRVPTGFFVGVIYVVESPRGWWLRNTVRQVTSQNHGSTALRPKPLVILVGVFFLYFRRDGSC